MNKELLTIDQLGGYVSEIIFGTVFIFFGLAAAVIGILRRGKGSRILIWLAMWSGMYGIRLLIIGRAVRLLFPEWLKPAITFLDVSLSYLILVFALLSWFHLTKNLMRLYIQVMIIAGSVIALAGIISFLVSGKADAFIIYNNLIAAFTLIILLIVILSRKLSDRFLLLPSRGVLAAGTLIFAGEALYSNLSSFFNYPTRAVTGWLGFAVLLFSFAYVAAKMIIASEKKLIGLENELETARNIQTSILPASVPEINHLKISAAYYPMSEIAGDFYEFIPIDTKRAGFLVADVSGHGIPAALIASMIKIATQSVKDAAHDPGEVLRRLNEILKNQLRGQFLTAAYLYIDTDSGIAYYSAAGHPPMLHWDSTAGKIKYIESNGLLIGFRTGENYPVAEIHLHKGDRFILYTDGLTEPENEHGEQFGDRRLHDIIRANNNIPAPELGAILKSELFLWQEKSGNQQDDITWVIIDVN
jgi:sigma-B regulation protein RsbU (phosphoserine phosphatase)